MATTSRYAPDKGLTARMGVTMFLLGLLYLVLFGVLGLILGDRPGGWFFALVISGGLLAGQWYFSDTIALAGMGAREVSPQQEPELHAIIDRLCAMADMPKPRVAIADTDLPNAFATGRSKDKAVVCATTGLMRRLNPSELEGVLSHELSHVAHNDVTVMTVASFVGVLAGFLTRMVAWGSLGRDNRDQNAAAVFALVMVVSVVVYAVSFVLIRVLSRYRELSADRSGALLTGQPSALASALVKVSGDMGRIPTRDLRQAEAFNAFFFTPAFAKGGSLSSIFATHPPLEKRLEQLQRISAQLNRAG